MCPYFATSQYDAVSGPLEIKCSYGLIDQTSAWMSWDFVFVFVFSFVFVFVFIFIFSFDFVHGSWSKCSYGLIDPTTTKMTWDLGFNLSVKQVTLPQLNDPG